VEDALLFWRDALGLPFDGIEEVPEETVKVGFLDANGVHIELLEPTTDDSGVAKYLDKRGPGMHHLCLEVDDLEQAMASLKAKGMQLIYEEPRVRDNGRRYTFVHPKSTGGVMIELYEADKA
ncbi:MAG: methylmalonyl-CoA epimerase, partial [Anaerolineae bacterium]|nr:methylmalonyl-CoA epimerase [Anaerolineae bacterium]